MASIRRIIKVFLVLQVVATGLLIWRSTFKEKEAVDQLANQLSHAVTESIEERIQFYLSEPRQAATAITKILQSNDAKAETPLSTTIQNLATTSDLEPLTPFLWNQVLRDDSVDVLFLTNTKGSAIVVDHKNDQTTLHLRSANSTEGKKKWSRYVLSQVGEKSEQSSDSELELIDPLKRPWYEFAADKRQPAWTGFYEDANKHTNALTDLVMTLVVPVVRGNAIVGVFGVDRTPDEISQLLETLKLGDAKVNRTYIINCNTQEVIASSNFAAHLGEKGERKRLLKIDESHDQLIKNLFSEKSSNNADRNKNINQCAETNSPSIRFTANNEKQIAQVVPLQLKDAQGLNWLVVVVMPASYFTEKVNTNNSDFYILFLVASIVLMGWAVLKWILTPIDLLLNAADDVKKSSLQSIQQYAAIDEKEIQKQQEERKKEKFEPELISLTKRENEIGAFADKFVDMAMVIESLNGQLVDDIVSLRQKRNEIDEIYQQTRESQKLLHQALIERTKQLD
jgi:sigma-B regulation protein RsbU (phosphoserine phosphatase)